MTLPKLPQHQNPTRWQERQPARAPYNFVPLPEAVVTLDLAELPDHDQYEAGRHSGYLECVLTTAAPLYTRGLLDPAQAAAVKAKKQPMPPEFFYVDDANQPVIPGSTLRGLLRAMVEVVGYGKTTAVTQTPLVYRAVADDTGHGDEYRKRFVRDDGNHHYTPLVRAGYIEKDRQGNWRIRPAKMIGGTTFALLRIDEALFRTFKPVKHCKNASEIYIATGPYDYQSVRGDFLRIKYAKVTGAEAQPGPNLRPATLTRSGRMFSKKAEAVVYEPDDAAGPLALSDDLVQAYLEQLSPEQQRLLSDDPKDLMGVLRPGQPVFYLLQDNGAVEFFGHCRIFRLPYPHSPLDFVPEHLRREAELDLAEALFGYVKGKDQAAGKARAYAGRVTVTDATVQAGQTDLWYKPGKTIIPRILSGPKPTTFQHYLTQTQPDWVEIGRTRDDRPQYRAVDLRDYTAQPTTQAVIRGHKFYWHKGAAPAIEADPAKRAADEKSGKKDTQHTEIQPLRAGVSFTFRISFDNLSEVELGALIWVLNLAADEGYRLQVGMGKPLGMGAVQIAATLHLINRRERYRQLFDGAGWNAQAAPDEALRARAAQAFERKVLTALGQPAGQTLANTERMRALLKLLQWPGPDAATTDYMTLPEKGGVGKNEYKGRPVLPDPFGVGLTVPEVRPKVRHTPKEKPVFQKAARPAFTPPPQIAKPSKPAPIAPPSESTSQLANDIKALMATRAEEREAEEERKRQMRAARKKK